MIRSTIHSSEGTQINRCIFCGYSLVGLGRPCNCPECGQTYCQASAVWYTFAFPEHLTYLVPAGFLMLTGVQLAGSLRFPWLVPVSIVVYCGYVLASLARWLNGYYRVKRRPLVAFLPDTILVKARVRNNKVHHIGVEPGTCVGPRAGLE